MDIQDLSYDIKGAKFSGKLCTPVGGGSRPAVLVAHDWTGCNDFAIEAAKKVAAQGYIAFAIDMYGAGQCGSTNEEKTALMTPLMEDRSLLKDRVVGALNVLKQQPNVQVNQTAALGFCFGGLCALDLARSGSAVQGVVSFHGLLHGAGLPENEVNSKVLVLHGHDDPMVPPEQVLEFEQEMSKAQVDWQVHAYGGTVHAFTNPAANDPAFGTVYNATVADRAWSSCFQFLNEVFS